MPSDDLDADRSEEADLLRSMIADREQRIALIERRIQEQHETLKRVINDEDEAVEQSQQLKIAHQTEKTRLLHDRQSVLAKLQAVQRDLEHQLASLHQYAHAVTQHQAVGDAQHVMRMQAQLCKAMHSMGILDHQLELCQEHAAALEKSHKDWTKTLVDEKTTLEMQLLNQLMKTDLERKELENELQTKLNNLRKELQAVEKQIAEHTDEESNDGATTEETDEEERYAKDEAMQLLEEKKVEISNLEAEIKAQKAEIERRQQQQNSDGPGAPERPPMPDAPPPPPPPDSSDAEKEEEEEHEAWASNAMENIDIHHMPFANERVLELAARRAMEREDQQQHMASPFKSSRPTLRRQNSDDADEFDLLRLAQARLTGNNTEQSSDEESEEDETTSSRDRSYDDSENQDITEVSHEDAVAAGSIMERDTAAPSHIGPVTSSPATPAPRDVNESTGEMAADANVDVAPPVEDTAPTVSAVVDDDSIEETAVDAQVDMIARPADKSNGPSIDTNATEAEFEDAAQEDDDAGEPYVPEERPLDADIVETAGLNEDFANANQHHAASNGNGEVDKGALATAALTIEEKKAQEHDGEPELPPPEA